MLRLPTSFILLWLFSTLSFSADNWFSNLFSSSGRSKPKYDLIQFWDEATGRYRGLRVFYYMLPKDYENQVLEKRLSSQMISFLANMCEEIISPNSFDDNYQKKMMNQALAGVAEQWKQDGKIDPESFFNQLPFLSVDILVLMERTHYDQVWKKDEKRLLIGLNVGVFELDYGKALYMDRILTEAPWFGLQASFAKAEQKVLLQIADQIGDKLNETAKILNADHEEKVKTEMKTAEAREKADAENLKLEKKNLTDFAKNTESFLKDKTEPQDLLMQITQQLTFLKQSLKPSGKEWNAEAAKQSRSRAATIQDSLNQYQNWISSGKPQAQRNEPAKIQLPPQVKPQISQESISPATPVDRSYRPPNQKKNPLPAVPSTPRNLFDRQWLIPSEKKSIDSTPASVTAREVRSSTSLDPLSQGGPLLIGAPSLLLGNPRPLESRNTKTRQLPPSPPIPPNILDRFRDPVSATQTIHMGTGDIRSATQTIQSSTNSGSKI